MAPLVLFSTALTHLVGGSAGREGSAVQTGGAFAERVARWLRADAAERRAWLAAGLGAGFGAAIGAPLAGGVFGLEVLRRGAWRARAAPGVFIASFVATEIAGALLTPHARFDHPPVDFTDPWLAPIVIGGGAVFGLVARAFIWFTHIVENLFRRVPSPVARTATGGVALTLIFVVGGLDRYEGLGLDVIADSLHGRVSAIDPVFKFLLTTLTLGAGFKGGEFVPLVFVGSTLGAALGADLPGVPGVPLAALGFAAVFGAAARVPVAGAVMAAELFGLKLFIPALVGGYVAFRAAGARGIYDLADRPNSVSSAGTGDS